MTTLKNCKIYTENGVLENASIRFNTTITAIDKSSEFGEDMCGNIIIPGFIDQHIHGVGGCDIMDGTVESLDTISRLLPFEGTTSFLATTLTESEDSIIHALTNIKQYLENHSQPGAQLLGVHLEGPFIACEYKGAQSEEHIKDIDLDLFDTFQKASGNHILTVTLAPEKAKALDLIDHLKKQNITISLGHSNATYSEVQKAMAHGANCFTHAYNAMSKFHHRDIGMVGALLLDQFAYAEVIADGFHVSDEALSLLYKNKTSEKTILITDSMRAKGMPDGLYLLGSQQVQVSNHRATLQDGTIAGSLLKMNDGVKRMKSVTDASIYDLIRMSAMNPAILHHIDDRKGSIALEKDADLLVINEQFEIIRTYCQGKRIV